MKLNNAEKRILGDLIWLLLIGLMAIGSFYTEEVRVMTFIFFGLVGLLYGLSFTEFGPFTQLPPGRYLAVKRGLNIVKYYLNQVGWGVANDGITFILDPKGNYLRSLEAGFFGFFFRHLGMVWTGIPVIGGVRGSMVGEKKIKYSQNADGTLKYWVEDIGPTYYTAPPFLRHYGFILGSIPSHGNNTWNFAIPSRIRVISPNDYDHRLANSPDHPVKGSFESALRPLIKNLTTNQVLNIKSENKNDTSSVASKAKLSANGNMVAESLGGYGYGVQLHDVDFQVIEPAEPEFAKAIRMKEIASEVGLAKLEEAEWRKKEKLKDNEADVEIINTQGEAVANAQRKYVQATGNNPAAWLAKGMGDIKEGVTLVLGDGVMRNIPLGDGIRHKKKGEEATKTTEP